MNQFTVCKSLGLGLKIGNERQEVCVKGGIEVVYFAAILFQFTFARLLIGRTVGA